MNKNNAIESLCNAVILTAHYEVVDKTGYYLQSELKKLEAVFEFAKSKRPIEVQRNRHYYVSNLVLILETGIKNMRCVYTGANLLAANQKHIEANVEMLKRVKLFAIQNDIELEANR